MVICTYFQRGVCRFGDRCRNEHLSSFSYKTDSKTNEIRGSVTLEAETVLNGKQWILSSFAPFRDKPGFIIPNFIDDISPEEVRWEYYQAKENGTLAQYAQSMSRKLEDATKNMQLLKSASLEVLDLLYDLYNGKVNPSRNNPFRSNNNCFGGSNNVFSQSMLDRSNGFASPNNAFGQPNVFANSVHSNQVFQSDNANGFQQTVQLQNQMSENVSKTSNVFNSGNSNAITGFGSFSSPQTSASFAFAQQQPNSTNSSINNTGFNQTSNAFGQPPSNNPFANNKVSTNSPFAKVPNAAVNTNNVFDRGPPIANKSNLPFSQTAITTSNNSPFGQHLSSAPGTSPFKQPSQSSVAVVDMPFKQPKEKNTTSNDNLRNQECENIFQKAASVQVNDNPFLYIKSKDIKIRIINEFKTDDGVFTEVKRLNDGELNAFKSRKFKIGMVPLQAPTKDLCVD